MLRGLKTGIICFLCVLIALPLAACGVEEDVTHLYKQPEQMTTVSSGAVAENQTYVMQWNDEKKCVLLTEKATGHTWSTIPYNHLQSGDYDYSLEAPLTIEYYDPFFATIQTVSGIDCVDYGTIAAEKTQNGIAVTYYFPDQKIAVGVVYELREDSLLVSLNTEDLQETEDAQLVSVSLAPYLCSVQNSADSSNYLFVPSGSGALMYANEDMESGSREYTGYVYGEDLTRMPAYQATDNEPIRLPVFGASAGEQAICAIIEQGASAASISASAGNVRTGYTNAYATFHLREYNITDKSKSGKIAEYASIADDWSPETVYSVGYYPLKNEDANYSGMAALYRQYLKEQGTLKQSEEEQKSYLVNVLGGDQIKTFTLGVPHNTLQKATTFEQAQTMLQQLTSTSGEKPTVVLSGFGSTGLTPGKVAGGFTFANALGGLRQQQALEAYCREQGITLYTDFDILFFSKSGKGYNTIFDSAKCATLRPTYIQSLKVNVRDADTTRAKMYVLGRNQLNTAVEKLLDFCNDKISGISLSSLGQYSYSDYADEAYYAQNGMAEQTVGIISDVQSQNHSIHFSAANAYAAAAASCISQVPTGHGGYDALDEVVPFYAMVFCGSRPMYSGALNTAMNAQALLLRAVEGGMAPSFTLAYEYDSALADSPSASFYGTKFENNLELIDSTVKQVGPFLEKVNGAQISKHELLDDGVTKTTFSNDVSVVVNHTDDTVVIGEKEIAPMSFVVLG